MEKEKQYIIEMNNGDKRQGQYELTTKDGYHCFFVGNRYQYFLIKNIKEINDS